MKINYKNYTYLILLFIGLLYSCNYEEIFYVKQQNNRSIFIDNKTLYINQSDIDLFNELDIGRIYVSIFDVKWDYVHNEIPVNILQKESNVPETFDIVPVIKIENLVFENLDSIYLDEFSDKLLYKIGYLYSQIFPSNELHRIQIDCKWTTETQNSYFYLLKKIKLGLDDSIELAVSLDPYMLFMDEFFGVPPADVYMLNYFNFTPLNMLDIDNYIIDNSLTNYYLTNPTFPEKFNLVLPVFSNSISYNKTNPSNYFKYFETLTENSINYNPNLTKLKKNIFSLNDDTVIEGQEVSRYHDFYLQTVTLEKLLKAKDIAEKVTAEDYEIIIFMHQLNSSKLYNNNDLEKIFSNN